MITTEMILWMGVGATAWGAVITIVEKRAKRRAAKRVPVSDAQAVRRHPAPPPPPPQPPDVNMRGETPEMADRRLHRTYERMNIFAEVLCWLALIGFFLLMRKCAQ